MGAEKALHIKSLASGISPSCIVLNVTVRSMKLHGGGVAGGGGSRPTKEEIETENVEAVRTEHPQISGGTSRIWLPHPYQ